MDLSLLAAEGGWQEFVLKGGEWAVLLLSVAAALLALGVGVFLARPVLAEDEGTPKMREIAAGHPGGRAGLPQAPVPHDRRDPRPAGG